MNLRRTYVDAKIVEKLQRLQICTSIIDNQMLLTFRNYLTSTYTYD